MRPTETVGIPVIRVFGGAGLEVDGVAVGVGGPRQRRLLALLAIRSPEVVDNDWLSEYLWNDRDRPADSVPAIRTYVSRLRSSFPEAERDWIQTEQAGYRLAAPPEALEHRTFTDLRKKARNAREAGDPATAEQMIDRALALWRGEPFRELEDLDWAQAEISRIRLDRLEMLEERWEVALALGRHTQITGELAAFTAEYGLRERAARQYALALYRSGRSTEALRVIDAHRRLVGDLSGLDPSAELTALENAILAGDPDLDWQGEGTPLRGYRLVEQVGSGAFSVVWRATQPSVDRQVAVKQIRAELAALPEFIRRFEVEAQIVARIEHPHIVPLIDFWRDPDAAYLVMRWLAGGTLERLLDDGPLPIDETLSIVDQIGSALSAAHARDVIHRDVKTANVMFDEFGNAYLTDFGIALAAAESSGPEAALSVGSPAYASPEQLRREPLTPASDVFSLGVVVYECLVGSTPFSDSASAGELVARQLDEVPPLIGAHLPDVPRQVEVAVARALSKKPSERFRSVDEFVLALTGPHPRDAEAGGIGNPYLGLRAFDEADRSRFFGRRRLVAEMLKRFSEDGSPALMVVGPSGSGKSSAVRAGLLPAVREGAIPGSSGWYVTTMVPGDDPYRSLHAALLRVAVDPPALLLEQLRNGPRGVLRAVRRCIPDDGTVLLVIDQFEELFGASAPADEFLGALSIALKDPSGPLRLAGTLRADYYHRPLEHPAFASILKEAAIDVTPLAPDELEEAITGPAELAGVTLERGLAARIAAEAIGQPSPLPLMQHLLADLYERRSGTTLTLGAYEELGGLGGALAARAEEIHRSAGDDERAAIRRVFGRLTDPDRTDLRRRALQRNLGREPAVQWVLDSYGSARLLTFDRDPASREPTVEVSHEALLREWPRLAAWLDEDRELLRAVDTLSTNAAVWNGAGRQTADLLRGPRLAAALDLAAEAPERLPALGREFVEASRSHAEAERTAERRRVRRLRRLNVAVSLALVFALAAAAVAVLQRREADAATVESQLAELISRSEAVAADQPDLAVLLALEAHRRMPGQQTERAVLNALAGATARITLFSLPVVDTTACAGLETEPMVSADGTTGFVEIGERLISVDLTTGKATDRGPSPAPCVRWIGDEQQDIRWVMRIAPTFGGRELRAWTGSWDGPLTAVEVDRWDEPVDRTLVGNRIVFSSGLEHVLVNARTGAEVARIPHRFAGETAWALSQEGRHVMVGGDTGESAGKGEVFVLDGRTGEVRHQVALGLIPAAMSIHGDVALIGGRSGRLATIDLDSGRVVSEVATTTSAPIVATGLNADGHAVVAAQDRVEVVDLDQGTTTATTRIDVWSAVVRPDGAVAAFDPDRRNVWLVDTGAITTAERLIAVPDGAVVGFGLRRAAAVHPSGEVELIDLDTGARSVFDLNLETPGFGPLAAFPSKDGFVAFGRSAIFARWQDGAQVERIQLLAKRPGDAVDASFAPVEILGGSVAGPAHAPGGAVVVTPYPISTSNTPEAYLVAWEGGQLAARLVETTFPNAVSAVPSADGGVHVLNADGRLRTYGPGGRWLSEVAIGLRSGFVMASAAGGRIAAGGSGGAVIVDTETGEILPIEGLTRVSGMAFAGGLLVSVDSEGTVQLWDGSTAASLGILARGGGQMPSSMPWHDAERGTVWVATSGRLLEFSLNPERWVEKACDFVDRDLTQNEWDRFVPGGEPLTSACS